MASIIIDHRTIDTNIETSLAHIPQAYIEAAKNNLCIAYGTASHGTQLIYGMNCLKTWDGTGLYDWANGGAGGALDIRWWGAPTGFGNLGISFSIELLAPSGTYDSTRAIWVSSTRTYLNAHPEVNVCMWAWCFGMATSESDINLYLSQMATLESEYPGVTFVYMTGRSDGTGLTGLTHLRARQIRDYCIANNKPLYDFYDIECYDPSGSYFGDKAVSADCSYTGGNWATEWQTAHPGEWFACANCPDVHAPALNCNVKAVAAWNLWARLAGWDGVSDTRIINWENAGVWDGGVKGIPDTSGWDVINVKTGYGAVGDGVTDDTVAIRNAINAAGQNYIVYFPAGTYRFSALNCTSKSRLLLKGAGASLTTLRCFGSGSLPAIRFDGLDGLTGPYTISSGATKGSKSIVVSSVTGLAVGDIVTVYPTIPSGFPGTAGVERLPVESTMPPVGQPYEGWSYNTVAYPRTGVSSNCQWYEGFGQLVEIAAINGSTLTLVEPLYYDYSSYSPLLKKRGPFLSTSGIESMKIQFQTGITDGGHLVRFWYAKNCWIKKCELYWTHLHSVYIRHCKSCEITNNYLHHGLYYIGDTCYLISMADYNSDHLVYDNIVYHGRHHIVFEGGGQGCVVGYNYSHDTMGDTARWMFSDIGLHGRHPYMNLWEGNNVGGIEFDSIHGSSSHNFVLRNYCSARGSDDYGTYTSATIGMKIAKDSINHSFTGNVLGYSGCSGDGYSLEHYESGYYTKYMQYIGASGDTSGPVSANPDSFEFPWSMPRHTSVFSGNYDYVGSISRVKEPSTGGYAALTGTDATHVYVPTGRLNLQTDDAYNGASLYNKTRESFVAISDYDADNGSGYSVLTTASVSSQSSGDVFSIVRTFNGNVDSTIVDSLYLSSKPAWFGSLSWPAIGPDVSGYVQDIPAKWRWDNYVAGGSSDVDLLFTDAAPGTEEVTVAGTSASTSWASGSVTLVRSAAASDYLEGEILDHVFKVAVYTAPTNIYVALCKSTIDDTHTGSTLPGEVTGGGYVRTLCNTWSVAADGFVSNENQVIFPSATADWGTITDIAICDSQTVGEVLVYGKLFNYKDVETGDIMEFEAGGLRVTLD